MALTRDFKQTVVERIEREPAFAQALLDEADALFLNGESETARLILRDLISAKSAFSFSRFTPACTTSILTVLSG